jgi:hypothetical protein
MGVFLSLIVANADPNAYFYYFNNGVVLESETKAAYGGGVNGTQDIVTWQPPGQRRLAGDPNAQLFTMPFCSYGNSYILGHPFSIKFFANDVIMVFFFVSPLLSFLPSLLSTELLLDAD